MNGKYSKTRFDKLKNTLDEDKDEEISLICQHHGSKTFTIGQFLKTKVVCAICSKEYPVWHKDQLFHPVVTALVKLASTKKMVKKT